MARQPSASLLVSELEYLVLALVDAGAKSGYGLRIKLQGMRGIRWSAESGSVYRILRRLSELGMIVEEGRAGAPRRERIEYAVTDFGKETIRTWVESALSDPEVEQMVDATRTKAMFLHLLPSKRARADCVRGWMRQNAVLVAILEGGTTSGDSETLETWSERNLLFHARARQDWLRKLLAAINKDRLSLN